MKIYYDTEFKEVGHQAPVELISIGMVAENGDTFYAVNSDMSIAKIKNHHWLRDNVLPYLPTVQSATYTGLQWDFNSPELMPRTHIRDGVYRFIVEHASNTSTDDMVDLWAWYGAYDHVVFAQLWNTMSELPPGIPMYTNDLRQEIARLERLGHKGLRYKLPKDKTNEHHALADAQLLKIRAEWVAAYTEG